MVSWRSRPWKMLIGDGFMPSGRGPRCVVACTTFVVVGRSHLLSGLLLCGRMKDRGYTTLAVEKANKKGSERLGARCG